MRLARRIYIGFAYYLKQWHARTVEIHEAGVFSFFMDKLSRVFFQMDPFYPYGLFRAVYFYTEVPVLRHRFIVLRDLVILRQVRIKIIFSVEFHLLRDRAVDRVRDFKGAQ